MIARAEPYHFLILLIILGTLGIVLALILIGILDLVAAGGESAAIQQATVDPWDNDAIEAQIEFMRPFIQAGP